MMKTHAVSFKTRGRAEHDPSRHPVYAPPPSHTFNYASYNDTVRSTHAVLQHGEHEATLPSPAYSVERAPGPEYADIAGLDLQRAEHMHRLQAGLFGKVWV